MLSSSHISRLSIPNEMLLKLHILKSLLKLPNSKHGQPSMFLDDGYHHMKGPLLTSDDTEKNLLSLCCAEQRWSSMISVTPVEFAHECNSKSLSVVS